MVWMRIKVRNGLQMFDASGDYADKPTARQAIRAKLRTKGLQAEVTIAAPGELLDETPRVANVQPWGVGDDNASAVES